MMMKKEHRSADFSSSVSKGTSLSSISEQDDSPSSSTGVNITKFAKQLSSTKIYKPSFLSIVHSNNARQFLYLK